MSITELQTEVIKFVLTTEDKAFLQKMVDFFKSHQKEDDWWLTISDYEKEMIEIGVKEIDEGKGIPYEQVRIEVDKILKKN